MNDPGTGAGHEWARCGGKRHGREDPCRLPAGWGTSHPGHGRCKLHGGSSPSGRAAGLAAQARAEVERLGVVPAANPLEQLAALAAKARLWEELLSAKVAALTSLTYDTAAGSQQVHAEILLWERALDRCGAFCATLAKLDIDQRITEIQVQSAKIIGDEVAALVNRIFARTEFNCRAAAVAEVVAEEIRAMPAAAVRYAPPRYMHNGHGR
jgi:hypothetical protein